MLGGSVQPDMVLGDKKVRVGSESRTHATVILVRLTKDPELKHYFQERVSKIGLQLMFPDSTSNPSKCLLDVYVNPDGEWRRIFTYSTFDWMLSMTKRKPFPLHEYVAIVGAEARVVAEHRLPTQSVRSLTGVTVRAIFVTKELYESPRCAIVP